MTKRKQQGNYHEGWDTKKRRRRNGDEETAMKNGDEVMEKNELGTKKR